MQYSLLVCASPEKAAAQTALLSAQAILAAGHSIQRLFFYRDAVRVALHCSVSHSQWRQLILEHGLDAVLCVNALQQRNMAVDAQLHPWNISGLGQLAEVLSTSNRVLTFA